ncbi:MAG: hypothetical protein EA393_06645 [Bacteroidetes bacterium]|nr:MAG: hypothetical protein EA393_06645 [Bacteroidota bacterium]
MRERLYNNPPAPCKGEFENCSGIHIDRNKIQEIKFLYAVIVRGQYPLQGGQGVWEEQEKIYL